MNVVDPEAEAENTTRGAFLDAAERIMLTEGYAAVTTRRLGAAVGVNHALINYHFGSMDNLLIEVFRRGVDRSRRRQTEALNSAQPLWALWEHLHDESNTALIAEFLALAHHHTAIRTEVADSSRRLRELQLAAVAAVLENYGTATETHTPEAIVLTMSGISHLVRMEAAFGIHTGHTHVVAMVERLLHDLEGDRRNDA